MVDGYCHKIFCIGKLNEVISSIKDHKVIMQETKAETARQVKKLEC
jgi:hypothetical protein